MKSDKMVRILFKGIPIEGYAEDICIKVGESMSYLIYGKDNCIHCERAKNFAIANNIPFEYFTLGDDYTKEELVSLCHPVVPRTVPQIFRGVHDEKWHIGGADEFIESFSSN